MSASSHRYLYEHEVVKKDKSIGNLSRAIYDESGAPLWRWIIDQSFDGEPLAETIARLLHNEMKKETAP